MTVVDLTRKLRPASAYAKRTVDLVKYIVLHHTAGPPHQTPREIHDYHRSRGWGGIGYHYLVYSSGTVYKVRPITSVPACVRGMNRKCLCIAWVWDASKSPLTFAAEHATADLLQDLTKAYPWATVTTHRHLDPDTECPGKFGSMSAAKICSSLGIRYA